MPTHGSNRGPKGSHGGSRPGGAKPAFRRPFTSGGSSRRPMGGSRPQFGGRGGSRGGGRGKGPGSFSDITKFVNKAVITEEVEKFVPEHRFADFLIDERVKKNIADKGYIDPTPIQDRAIPHVIRGVDVVGIANTGTGKTAAFLIPLINKRLSPGSGRVLIMVPTRELAMQIADEFKGFAKGLGLYSTVCVGGASIGPQMSELRRRPAFVIGTPGRLKDLLERKALNLSDFTTAVLDEADRMLDMGFIQDMRKILSLLPNPRHTLFFSATLSTEIERLIGEFLREPVRISVKTRDTSASIDQDIVRVPSGAEKIQVLHDLLIQPGFDKVLIFGRTKHGVEKLSKALVARGFKSESIHGNKSQGQRVRALDYFKKDHVQILCATDVAARGLDINGVSHVINYDLPNTHEDYIHRIGRTGRAGKKGKALTFIGA
ncbi:MAG TPA: DEAD/DEAH box helicase [Candidatus Paceibacterota bacterium]